MSQRVLSLSLPRRGLQRLEAAQYVGVGATKFDEMVRTGRAPPPRIVDDIRLWDIFELDDYFPPRLPVHDKEIIKGVYVVGFSSYVKIGVSKDIYSRKIDLECGLPETLTVYATLEGWIPEERALHRRFAPYRTRLEWFRHEGELADWIKGGCK